MSEDGRYSDGPGLKSPENVVDGPKTVETKSSTGAEESGAPLTRTLLELTEARRVAAESELERARLQVDLADLERARLQVDLADARRDLALWFARAREAATELHRVLGSRSWRVTRPLRVLGKFARGDWPALKLSVRPLFLRLSRKIYRSIPLSPRVSARLAEVAFRIAGPMFEGIVTYDNWKRSRQALRPTSPRASLSWEVLVAKVRVPDYANPEVSVLILAYGNLSLTLTCLLSICEHPPIASFEVIVVGDGSGQENMRALADVHGLRYVDNDVSLGFARSCNRASILARGRYLCFLKSDVRVTSSWLDPLLNVFVSHPAVGLVGSKLIYPDGRLQEAGGIIWRDGSTWKFGWLHDPESSEFNYVKEVDYCSGSSILIRKDVFESLGGFDERYGPGYCEDADLAFRVRGAGMKVHYQPKSVVVHDEGAPRETSVAGETKADESVDRQKFVERWRDVLAQDHFADGESVFFARDRTSSKPCVMVVDQRIPQPDKDAGSRSMLHILRSCLDLGMNVKFWPDNLWFDPVYGPPLQQLGIEVFHQVRGRSIDFSEWVRENGRYVECFLLSRPEVASHLIGPIRRHSQARIIYYGHDIHHLRLRDQLRIFPRDARVRKDEASLRAMEHEVWKSVDVIYYPSDSETEFVRQWLRERDLPRVKAETVPLLAFDNIPERPGANLSMRQGLLFVAGFAHAPNVDGAVWFVGEVFPALIERFRDVHLFIVGSNPPPKITGLASARVAVTGSVSDDELAAYYRRCRVAVAPLRFGAGLKGKVLEAMRFGLPIVTTPVGLQGMNGAAEFVPAVPGASAMVEAIARLLFDDESWKNQSLRQQEFVRAKFSADSLRSVLRSDLLPVRDALTGSGVSNG